MPGLEPILDAALPIVDAHHHLWDRRGTIAAAPAETHDMDRAMRLAPRYLLDELLADLSSGHDIRQTVFIECRAMHRRDGAEAMKPVGETEFVNGVAAMSASGAYGETQVCAAIVGHADLRLGEAVAAVLEAHLTAGGGRFRGIRQSGAWDRDPRVLGPVARAPAGLYGDPKFRAGFAKLAPLGLSFEAWVLEPQLSEVADLAAAFPQTQIVLDHLGTPLGIASYTGRLEERFSRWRASLLELARRPNVSLKLGGLGMPFPALPAESSSEALAATWRPYIEAGVQAFGAERCMFESNFPVDLWACSYRDLWNTFKRVAAAWSPDEKAAAFSGTARRVYRI